MIDTRFQTPRIGEVLESIRRHGLSLLLELDDAQIEDISILLSLEPAAQTVVLDAPRGKGENRYLPGQILDVTVWKNGIQLKFKLEIKRRGSFEDRPALYTGWPYSIEYVQRRNAFRIRLRSIRGRADILLDNGIRIPGRILDISVTGFSAVIEQDIHVEPDQKAECEIEIDRKSWFFTRCEIRNVHRVGITNHLRIGARFLGLAKQHEIRLEKLVREFEREQLRARHGNSGEPG